MFEKPIPTTRFRAFCMVRYNCDMPTALHHAIDLIFMMSVVLFGRSIRQNAEVVALGFSTFSSLLTEAPPRISAESMELLGSALFLGGVLAAIAYLAVIPLELFAA